MRNLPRREEGFSLLEVLAAITILSVVSLTMTAFFVQAMNNAKGNENKTVAVNLARNALFYAEKQKFSAFRDYFDKHDVLDLGGCSRLETDEVSCAGDADKTALFQTAPGLWDVMTAEVNGQAYWMSFTYKPELLDKNEGEGDLENYLLPIVVAAASANDPANKRYSAEVEGYIVYEKIR